MNLLLHTKVISLDLAPISKKVELLVSMIKTKNAGEKLSNLILLSLVVDITNTY